MTARWYIVHAYSNFEKKVSESIEEQARQKGLSHEIEQVFWVPVRELRDPATHTTVDIPLPGGTRPFPCFAVAGEIVWGLTHRILTQFLDVAPELRLDRLTQD